MADKNNFESFYLTPAHIWLSRHLEFHPSNNGGWISTDPLAPFDCGVNILHEEDRAKKVRDIGGLTAGPQCACNSSLCKPCLDEAKDLYKNMGKAINIILRCGPRPGKYLKIHGVWELREPFNF